MIDRDRLLAPQGTDGPARHIAGRRRDDARAFASAGDFRPGDPAPAIRGGSVYALDAVSGTATLCDVGYDALTGAAFAYAEQAERAQIMQVRAVETLPLSDRPVIGLFSIGRCGSTLLGHVLSAAGATVLSELDAFTALGPLSRRWPGDAAIQDRLTTIAAHLKGHAATHAPDGPLVLKFRSQSMQAARAICGAGVAPVLLTRAFPDWANSNARHFPDDPLDGRIDALAHGLSEMAGLSPRILDYGALLADPVAAAALCLGRPVPPARQGMVRACLDRDSQAGTALAASRATTGPDHLARAERSWLRHLRPESLSALGLGTDLLPLRAQGRGAA